jgi:uncharacterized protein involved in outer membrane biogenesis
VDPSVFRSQLEARGTTAFGRQVKINGLIHLERSLRPRIILEDISIANPEWATGERFAAAEKVSLQVALLPLLSGKLRILDVSLNGVDLFIEEGPDGVNNYTFGDRSDSKTLGVLPPIEQLLVKDAAINHQSANESSRYEISEVRLQNIPGQPERIEGKGAAKGMAFTFLFAAETPAELSGPQNPWSAKLNINGPDMSAHIDGHMAEPFKWENSEFRITISAKQADTLETLFGVNFPMSGLFELSAKVNTSIDSFRLTDINASTEELQLKAQGTVARPLESNEFEFKYELMGKEIKGLRPLADFVLPLRGEFRAKGRINGRDKRFSHKGDLRIGKSDLKADITVLRERLRPKITGRLLATQVHLDDLDLFDVDKGVPPAQDKPRAIPDYTLPVEAFLAADLDLAINAERIHTQLGVLGEFVSKVRLKDGLFNSYLNFTGAKGGRIKSEFELNTTADPPLRKVKIDAKDVNVGYLLSSMDFTELVEGQVDLSVDLSGTGASRYDFLGNAAGRITIIGGPGQITGRRIDLWAADLIPTMLSPRWEKQDVFDVNCMVAHIRLKEGLAEIQDCILDSQRITVASSGILNLETEALDLVLVPKPKRPSLVSLANPVKIKGTLSEPEVSVTRISKKRRLAATGALAALINPVFLLFAFSDIGTIEANPCESAVERAHKENEANRQ